MHDSYTPIGGMVPLVNIAVGEIIFGGVGSGLYGMLLFVIVAMFIAGLMVGRTPEYLGKKLESKEVKMAMLAILIVPMSILGLTALAICAARRTCRSRQRRAARFQRDPIRLHLGTGNNGSAFAGLSANTPFYNTTLGIAMLIGRFMMIVPVLAMAGSLARKKIVPGSAGTFPTDSPLFVGLWCGVIVIVGALVFFPALSLGPIVEHLAMHAGTLFDKAAESMEIRSKISAQSQSTMLDPAILVPAIGRRSQARTRALMIKNPVMFVVEIVAALTTVIFLRDLATGGGEHLGFTFRIILWLWFTVLFANFAEAVAEGRGKAQAATLRKARTETQAKRLATAERRELSDGAPRPT